MGLDVSAFSQVKYLGQPPAQTGAKVIDLTTLGFDDYADDLQPGWYAIEGESYALDLGGAAWYKEWLNQLSLSVLGVPIQKRWDDFDSYFGSPFFELMTFFYKGGVFGPATSAKLTGDFDQYAEQALAAASSTSDALDFARAYQGLQQAFRLAGQDGFVTFWV